MVRQRTQAKLLYAAFAFALLGCAFFAAYMGSRYYFELPPQRVQFQFEVGKKTFPQFFTWPYFSDDPAVFVNLCVMVVTFLVFATTLVGSLMALRASTRATNTLINMERAYVTGGGGWVEAKRGTPTEEIMRRLHKFSDKLFPITVANYGKTPALLTHYDVHFGTEAEVRSGPSLVAKRFQHRDWIAPGHENLKVLRLHRIPEGRDIIFGCFWYLDVDEKPHHFRFILRIGPVTTHPNIADEVDPSYTEWT